MTLFAESFKTFNKLNDLRVAMTQLYSASCQTIFYRTAFMQQGAASQKWQQKEAHTMTSEKVDALKQSTETLCKGLVGVNQSVLSTSQKNMQRLSEITPPASATDLLSVQSKVAQMAEANAADAFSLSNELIDTLTQSIKPVHGYASSNADRLSVVKKR